MSDVTPTNGVSSPALAPLARKSYSDSSTPVSPVRAADKVELSKASQYLSKLLSQSDVRTGLVDRVKSEIANGTYETPDKLDAAFEDLLTDLA